MFQVRKSWWRERYNVYEVDTGGTAWLASFRSNAEAWFYIRDLEQRL